MDHPGHEHLLILNEIYIAKEGDICTGCREQIDSCKSFVYSCSNITSTTSTSTSTSTTTSGVENLCVKFLLHKTCAELPPKIVNPADQEEFLVFYSVPRICKFYHNPSIYYRFTCCNMCGFPWRWFSYCSSSDLKSYICFKCAVFLLEQSKEDPIFVHPGHSHPVTSIQQPSSFKCHACKVNNNILDLSYRCTKCQFWVHKSCADAPASFQFQFHDKHPLILLFSVPQIYRRFPQQCRLCNETLNPIDWLYYCPRCRFFTHFQCARSSSMLRFSNETYPDVMHLPAANESSLNLLLEQFVKDKITLHNPHHDTSSIFSATNSIKHWAHEEHDLKLITTDELYDQKNDDEILLLCYGCVKPIRTDDSLLYGCVPCKYFMHKVCAELPREVEHHLWPGVTLFADKYIKPYELFWCAVCARPGNGIFFGESVKTSDRHNSIRLHIGCVILPKIIKHEAHHHQLDEVREDDHNCNACGVRRFSKCKYRCEKCNFYICAACITMVRRLKHTWDPHPLDLIYDAGMVTDHEHDFDCEFCSSDIDTNTWFYHCSDCDLSFHPYCLKYSSYTHFRNIKFGATDIIVEKLHPHGLTFVLNKKVRSCEKCGIDSQGIPVLQCAPCNTIFCQKCLK